MTHGHTVTADGRQKCGDTRACGELTATQLVIRLHAWPAVSQHAHLRRGLTDVRRVVFYGRGDSKSLNFTRQPVQLVFPKLRAKKNSQQGTAVTRHVQRRADAAELAGAVGDNPEIIRRSRQHDSTMIL